MLDKKIIGGYTFERYHGKNPNSDQLIDKSAEFLVEINKRRSVRDFSSRHFARETIDNIILAASSSPSGAHKQPWTFCVVSNPNIKSKIRLAAEKEEYEAYHGKMPQEWLDSLKPFQTDWKKPFLEKAPYLIVVFKKIYELLDDGSHSTNYYVSESVGIACGFLLTAIHYAGLVALTHTPNPMNFLNEILERPKNERPYLIIPVGYPDDEVYVPVLERKKLEDVAIYYN